jgi:hypothetical protein
MDENKFRVQNAECRVAEDFLALLGNHYKINTF